MEELSREESIMEVRKMFFGVLADYSNNFYGWPTIKIAGYNVGIGLPMFLERIRTMPLKDGDVIVSSFPKCGTTWMQHIAYLLATEDFDGGNSVPIDVRVPELELPTPYPCKPENLDAIAKRDHKLLKTHLPVPFLPYDAFKGKIIYMYRNPKDMAVSIFHHLQVMPPHFCDDLKFEQVAEMIMGGEFLFGPWQQHVNDYHKLVQEGKPVLMVAYEELKREPHATIKKVSAFLGRNTSDEFIDRVVQATSFEAMKNNKNANYSWLTAMSEIVGQKPGSFVRKGIVGDWKNHFTPDLLARFDAYIADAMKDSHVKIYE